MKKYTCEYCNTTFTVKSNLSRHQRLSRYCLQGRGLEIKEYPCICNRIFSRNDVLQQHQRQCDIYMRQSQHSDINQNELLLKVIESFQRQILDLSARPTIVNHTNNGNSVVLNNLPPITDEEIQENLGHLTIDFINNGAKGYANFANDYTFKDRVVCTDKARKKLRYKGKDGELIEDGGGVKLAQRFFRAIEFRNEELINAEYKTLHLEVEEIANNGTAYQSNFTDLLTRASHLQELLLQCRNAARGEENDLTKEFITHLSRLL